MCACLDSIGSSNIVSSGTIALSLLLWLFCFCFLQCAELGGTCGGTQQQPNKNQWSCVNLSVS